MTDNSLIESFIHQIEKSKIILTDYSMLFFISEPEYPDKELSQCNVHLCDLKTLYLNLELLEPPTAESNWLPKLRSLKQARTQKLIKEDINFNDFLKELYPDY